MRGRRPGGHFFYGSTPTLALADARKLLGFARAGLPVVLLGAFDQALTPGVPASGETERLLHVLTRLLALPNVVRVTEKTAVGDALATLGVTPDVRHSVPSTLLNAHRVTADADYYYLVNGKHAETVKPPVAAVDHDVTLRRAHGRDAVPYLLDPWTGKAVRVGRYTRDGQDVTLRTARGLTVRAGAGGTYRTRLSRGRTATTTLPAVPAPIEPDRWQVEVEDWRPGDGPTRTERVRRTLTLDTLLPCSSIPELADSAGIGRYRTTVTLPGTWTSSHGALLERGQVSDTFRVSVNGSEAGPCDRLNPVVDVGPLLRRGTNTIEIEVATPLVNRLRVSRPEVFGGLGRQEYGLAGPVRLVPYAQKTV
ncbi:hypothetical protein ACFCX6_34720 [Streptomyces sp. NPDC056353]|uniref:hypothetical protein n=1 Tax=Streptomyces sp. NPDC056353 TaxID=3345792 RepID=UPI0035DF881D